MHSCDCPNPTCLRFSRHRLFLPFGSVPMRCGMVGFGVGRVKKTTSTRRDVGAVQVRGRTVLPEGHEPETDSDRLDHQTGSTFRSAVLMMDVLDYTPATSLRPGSCGFSRLPR